MNRTPIEWCRTYAADGTFEEGHSVNPVRFLPRGASRSVTMCQKCSPGCANCYAERLTRRFWPPDAEVAFPGYTALGVLAGEFVLDEKMLLSVLKLKRPARIFWGDMTDLFQESVPDAMLDRCFAVAALTPHLTHMFLTKRPERMRAYMSDLRDEGPTSGYIACAFGRPARFFPQAFKVLPLNNDARMPWPLPNVWLGTSVENQEQADKRIPELLRTPAAVRFLSVEPLLGAVDLRATEYLRAIAQPGWQGEKRYPFECLSDECRTYLVDLLDWVIVGGESGAWARPMHPDWARSLRDQCVAAGVPFFFKQWGEWAPFDHLPEREEMGKDIMLGSEGHVLNFPFKGSAIVDMSYERMVRCGKKFAGRLLDGREWNEFPEVRLG